MVASIRIDLTVDRADGEVVGASGACWDPHNQTWFLDAGVELAPFAPWLPAAGRVDPSPQVPSDAEEPRGVPLSEFLVRVKGVVNAGLVEPVWVRAEIRKVQVARSKHVYLELEERDAGGLSIASTKGVIWAGRAPAICGKFSKGTGGAWPDIKVLVKVKADFHLVHGPPDRRGHRPPSRSATCSPSSGPSARPSGRRISTKRTAAAPAGGVRVAVICPATSAVRRLPQRGGPTPAGRSLRVRLLHGHIPGRGRLAVDPGRRPWFRRAQVDPRRAGDHPGRARSPISPGSTT
ncbi:MAG: exodeoxyribonuclease VII large subunit [Singulisphaera sp.]